MHIGFTKMCLKASEGASRPVVLGIEQEWIEAYESYRKGDTSISTMIEPTKQFITGRHAHNANPAGQQGKQSRIANVQHITPPVSSHVQQYNNVSINVDNDVLANHVSEQACIRCGGYILTSDLQSSSSLPVSTPATHSDISHCLFHLSIVDAHLKDKLTERQRLQLLHERTDMQGRHYCLVCNIDVDRLWDDGRGHGIVNAQSRQYISLCQRK
jgi:hypothetical protein